MCYTIIVVWLVGQAVKTPASHAGNAGSIPARVTILKNRRTLYCVCYVSNVRKEKETALIVVSFLVNTYFISTFLSFHSSLHSRNFLSLVKFTSFKSSTFVSVFAFRYSLLFTTSDLCSLSNFSYSFTYFI